MESLNGMYKISFNIQLDPNDQLSLSDVAQILTEGFGEPLVEKVSNLSIDEITKLGKVDCNTLKIGDLVQFKESVKIKAAIYSDDGYHFIGQPSEISEKITDEDVIIDIVAGSFGYVNNIDDNRVEVIDIDYPITKYASVGIDYVSIDLITVDSEQLEKIDSQEVR